VTATARQINTLQNTDSKTNMSRPQKIIPPIKGDFNSILSAVALGSGKGKKAAKTNPALPPKK
jgi:hypothetical protein